MPLTQRAWGQRPPPFMRSTFRLEKAAGTIRLRLKRITEGEQSLRAFANFDDLFTKRAHEADEFYATLEPGALSKEHCNSTPGAGGNALEQTILSLYRGPMARRRSRFFPAAAGA